MERCNQDEESEEHASTPVSLEENSATADMETEVSNNEDIYNVIQLGYYQKMIMKISNNTKVSVNGAIFINILWSILDIAFDILLFKSLISQGYYIAAMMIALFDYLPGIMLLLHDCNSSNWAKRSKLEKATLITLMLIQPFSLMLTNMMWLLNISSEHRQYMACLATIYVGCIEAPYQFITISVLWSKGILALPWQQPVAIIDDNDNFVYMGQLGLFSLMITTVGLLQSAIGIFEAHEEKGKIMVFTCTNILFRLLSYCFVTQYNKWFSVVMFVVLFLINGVVFSRRNKKQDTWIVILSSTICSIIVPVSITAQPHKPQLVQNYTEQQLEEKREQFQEMKMNAFLISVITTPLIFIMDIMVIVTSSFLDYKHNSIWSDALLEHWVCVFFLPMFIITMISAWSLYPERYNMENNSNANTNKYNTFVAWIKQIPKKIKQFMSTQSFITGMILGTIFISGLHCMLAPQVKSVILGYKNDAQELIIFDATALGNTEQKCFTENTYTKCVNLTFTFEDYRKVDNPIDNTFYVDFNVNATKRPPNSSYYIMESIYGWGRFAPSELQNRTGKELKCKKCLSSSYRCAAFLHGMEHVPDCEGMSTVRVH